MPKSSTSGQGRPKGSKNKATEEIQDLAREHTPAAIIELARLAVRAVSETARVAAINSLLDRGYGKPSQHVEVEHDGTITLESAAVSLLDALIAGTADTAASATPSHPLPN